MATQSKGGKGLFEKFAEKVTKATGSTPVFLGAFLIVVVWAICGPIFDYSETWQLVINTGTTIITFLMVFLIQKSQNKDSLAIQIKLNELVASHELASNRIVDVEDISEEEMEVLEKYYQKLAALAQKTRSLKESHSIGEAQARHEMKVAEREKSKAKSPGRKDSDSKAKKASAKTQTTNSKSQSPKTPNSKPKPTQNSK
ncbi:low affinity iron permease family protein [Flavobacterium sp. AG291]|uniref:low affinity iron permease family protein n=1 Tax=Flavobacterium sp. AG291 TaxID=2184000 RepID=UPI000E0C550D|nr:low affinity iron permease family protein [Flavobacterium sp. AG291]RDI10206.1 low affinity Fe/Cu permease [Flavobacterium sp. AG291]